MDSITQALLGASVAALVAPKEIRKSALLAGAILGTLPDLDVLLQHTNQIDRFTEHRGFSHSLLVLPFLSVALMPIFKKLFCQMSNKRLYFFILLPLITHPLLDSLTAYGTQLFYPLKVTPVFISSIFIVDFFYTFWLLVGVILYLAWSGLRWVNSLGIVLSSFYLLIGIGLQNIATNELVKAYPQTNAKDWYVGALTASPFCWRGVHKNSDNYIEVAFNILNPSFMPAHTYEILPESSYPESAELNKLRWFNPDTVLRYRDGQLISSDLRMGEFGFYNFEFIIKPDTKAGERLGWSNKPKWRFSSENVASAKYGENLAKDKNILESKWRQFTLCLQGKI